MSAEATLPATETPPRAPKKPRRWLKHSLYTLLALVVSLLALVGWLGGTESGLRTGLFRIPAWFDVHIEAKNLKGTLWHGFQGEQWRIQTPGSDIDIEHLALDWDNSRLWDGLLHVRRLSAGAVHIQGKDRPPQPESLPPVLPESIALPLQVQVDMVEVGSITTGSKRDVLLLPSQIRYRYDHEHHRLHIDALRTPWHTINGDIALNTTPPYALSGDLGGEGVLEEQAVSSHAVLSGSLAEPELKAQMDGGPIHLQTNARLKPFAWQLNHKLIHIDLVGRKINPQAFLSSLPKADIDFDIDMKPSSRSEELDGSIRIRNALPAALNHNGLPVQSVEGEVDIDTNGVIHIKTLAARLMQKGEITFNGTVDAGNDVLDVTAAIADVGSRDLLTDNIPGLLQGSIHAHGSFNNPQADWKLATETADSTGTAQLVTDPANAQQTLLLHQVRLQPKDGGQMQLSGSLALYQQQALEVEVESSQFNPNKLYADFPVGRVNGSIRLKGTLADTDVQGEMLWRDSTLSGAPLSGKAELHYRQQHVEAADILLNLGRNRIVANGSFGKAADKLNLDINAPQLDLFGFGLKGLLTAQGFVGGEPNKLNINLNGQARGLALDDIFQVQQLDFTLQGSPDVTQPLNIKINGQTLHAGGTRIDSIHTDLSGRGNSHNLKADARLQLDGKPYRIDLAANGGLDERYQWKGRVGTLDVGGAFNLKLLAPLQLEAGAERVVMNNARWSAMGGSLNLQSLLWDSRQGLTTKGNAANLALQQLHNIVDLGVQQNLVLSGDWDLSYGDNARGYLKVQQQSGDITLPHRNQALGLSKVVLDTRFHNGQIDNTLTGDTRYGNVDARVVIAQRFGNDITQAPISGHIKVRADDLNNFRHLLPVGMEARGSLAGDAGLSGTVAAPQLNGQLTGRNLYYRERENGVILENGTLQSRFQGRRWLIDSLEFKRHDGSVVLKGTVDMVGNTPDVDVAADFTRYRILDRASQRLTLSGRAQLVYTLQKGMLLLGELKVDQGNFGMPKGSMPTLDDDVEVIGRAKPETDAPMAIAMNLTLDLNDKFRFRGEGLDVLLGGKLTATSQPRENIKIVGTVNIVQGQYKAYGQDLIIEQGTISFVGPVDDPNLKLRATRRFSPVGAGVEVLGSLNNPRVSLVTNEPMSDKDKLSWLILGRASSGGTEDEAALSSAATAWLAGSINDRINLVDEIGFTSQQTRDRKTGELNPAEQVITVGKRLTNDLYLGYQYGLNSASQTVKLTYQISRTLQAIAYVGTDTAGGEVSFSIRFD
ncbi:translocation and assembly module TamB [Neisseria sp. HSC-16F19]|nr:translocation/assembly module TamB domain-containing protein [Neisseria sp. HSC-16F19]MCP2040303.1 translocation and assembly module TamB [Neisseria sp. HSC-16F19]